MSVVLNNNSQQCAMCNSDDAVRSQFCDHYLCYDCGLQDSCQGCQEEKDYLISRSDGYEDEAEPVADECSICYEEIDNKKKKVVTNCGHLFCLKCLLTQFQNKNECPMCRRELLENSPNSLVEALTRRYENRVIQTPGRALSTRPVGRSIWVVDAFLVHLCTGCV